MPEYFIRRGDSVSGPHSPMALKDGVANGEIVPDDLIGKSETGPWHEAKSVPGLVFPDSEKSAELSDDHTLELLGEYDYEPETPSPADDEKKLAEPQAPRKPPSKTTPPFKSEEQTPTTASGPIDFHDESKWIGSYLSKEAPSSVGKILNGFNVNDPNFISRPEVNGVFNFGCFGFFLIMLGLLITEAHWNWIGAILIGVVTWVALVVLLFGIKMYQSYRSVTFRPGIYLTPLYYVAAEYDRIRYCALWLIDDIKTVPRRDGNELKIFAVVQIGEYQIETEFKSPSAIVGFINQIDRKIDQAEKQTTNDPDAAREHVFPTSEDTIDSKSTTGLFRRRQLLATIGIAILSTVVGYSINGQLHWKQTPQHNYPSVVNSGRATPRPVPPQQLPKRPAVQPKPFFGVEQPLPNNGEPEWYPVWGLYPRPAKLTVNTPTGTSYYFIKIVNSSDDKEVFTVFMRAGSTFTTKMPVGTFKMRYATGIKWYGKKILFGPETSYHTIDHSLTNDRLTFTSREVGNSIESKHITVSLIKQRFGNLRTKNISASEW